MLKELFQYVVGLGNTEIQYENGQTYSTQPLHLLKEPTAQSVEINSLTGLVDYIKSKFDTTDSLTIHVESPTSVSLFSTLNNDKNRDYLVRVKALLPRIDYGDFTDPEKFNIKLQSCFVPNEHREQLLKITGNIQEQTVKSVGDDGISQSITAKTGVATVADVVVPNRVSLKPYRTFVEIVQPSSEFIFRMQSGPKCAIFEADGGAWKLQAMHDIKEYLKEHLAQEIEAGQIYIIA